MKKISLVLDADHLERLDLLCGMYGKPARTVVSELIDGATLRIYEQIQAKIKSDQDAPAATDASPTAAAEAT